MKWWVIGLVLIFVAAFIYFRLWPELKAIKKSNEEFYKNKYEGNENEHIRTERKNN